MENHKTTVMKYKGKKVHIDNKMVPLIRWCWDNDIATSYSCESNFFRGEECRPYIVFSSLADFDMFLAKLFFVVPHIESRICGGLWVCDLCLGVKRGLGQFAISCHIPEDDLEYIISIIEGGK